MSVTPTVAPRPDSSEDFQKILVVDVERFS